MTTVTVSDLPLTDTDVLVVGAGPTGLMAGHVLGRRGIPAVVIDAKAGPTRESRALAVQARTMEIYDQLGLAERVLAGAYPATRIQIRQEINPQGFNIEAAQRGSTRYPGLQIFEQSRNEEMLSSRLAETGMGVHWQHRLVDLLDNTDGTERSDERIVALVEGPEGLSRIRARWCVGADGARSAVRRIQDVPFEGVTDDAMFCVADLRGVSGLPDGTIAARFGSATFALLFPLGPGGHARLISLVDSDDVHQESALEAARTELGLSYTAVDWFSAYRVHHRVAAQFRKGSVFLAGDAAHVHSPVGAQGMNTGLQDAHNLANLLADVAQGHLDPGALDHYEHERRPVAQRLVKVTDRAFSVIARRSRGTAWFRRRFSGLMATLAPRTLDTPLGSRLGGYLGQYRIRYHFVPTDAAAPGWAEDRIVGLRLPPVGDNLLSLRTFTWQLHTYGTQATRPDVPDWVDGPQTFGPDAQGRLRPDRLYLVRPDGFVAASLPLRGGVVDATGLRSALHAHQVIH
jgi:2-polyprenyl-6-methoxyphenol hydroxylase-like FAD-dependent oxidoreductase